MCTYRVFNPNTVNRYFSIGCDGACKGCCNPEIKDWNLQGLKPEYVLKQVHKLVAKFDKLIDRIILVGGDPVDAYLHYSNEILNFIRMLRTLQLLIYSS